MALILAAGESRRMGCPKALLRVGDRCALDRIRETLRAAGIRSHRIVLADPHEQAIRATADLEGAEVVSNPEPARGRTSSIQAGLGAPLPEQAILLWPVDQPFVRAETVRTLLGRFQPGAVSVPEHEGRGGHPILIPASRAEEIRALAPDEPLRELVRKVPAQRVPVADPFVTLDVNTPEEFEAAMRKLETGTEG